MHNADASQKDAEGTANVPYVVAVEIAADDAVLISLSGNPRLDFLFTGIFLLKEPKGETPGDDNQEIKQADVANVSSENPTSLLPNKMSGENFCHGDGSQSGNERRADKSFSHVVVLTEGRPHEIQNEETVNEEAEQTEKKREFIARRRHRRRSVRLERIGGAIFTTRRRKVWEEHILDTIFEP